VTRHRAEVALALAVYPLVQLGLRLAVADGVEWDEAEQLIVTQSWALGYSTFAAQPPLYTWLQIAFFSVFGVGTFAIALLRACLQILTVTALYRSARLLGLARGLALLATLSLWLMPQYSVESLRMTHSVLVTCLAAALLHAVLRLTRHGRTLDYVWLGVVLGLGGMAKYNFILVAIALLAAAFSIRETRERLADRRFLLALLIAALIDAPHLAWVVAHVNATADHVASKIGLQPGGLWSGRLAARGVLRFLRALAIYTPPLVLWWLVFGRSDGRHATAMTRLIERFWMIGLSTLAVSVVVFATARFKEHWFQPFLFVLPLYLFLRLPAQVDPRRARAFAALLAIAIVSITGWKLVEVWAGHRFNEYSRLNDPFPALAARLREAGIEPAVIRSDHHVVAGSLRVYFPRALVITPGYRDVEPAGEGPCLIAWSARVHTAPQDMLEPWVPAGATIRYVEAPARRVPDRIYRLAYVSVPTCRW
jgi:4-amino-4-deoxy-L-arabinose transferase-like glycosyltransferase